MNRLCKQLFFERNHKFRRFISTVPYFRQNVLNIFDRQTKLLQRNRTTKNEDFRNYEYLKDEVGFRVADRIFDINRKFENVIDLGCGRGNVSKHVVADCVENLIMCDMSEAVLHQAALPEEGVKTKKMVVNEENLIFDPNTIDLVISSLTLHWVNDLPGTFSQVFKCLKNDGAFLGAIFGGDTLYELRSSLQLAETERLGGLSAHVSPFTMVSDIGGLLSQVGFTLLTMDTDEIVVGYPTMFELLYDLKGMGENNCAWKRSKHLNREVLIAAAAIYKELYGSDEKIPATFQIIYFLGWKPDPSQPKALERGSAEHSLKNLSGVMSNIRNLKKNSDI